MLARKSVLPGDDPHYGRQPSSRREADWWHRADASGTTPAVRGPNIVTLPRGDESE
jgi:hypothetical protein